MEDLINIFFSWDAFLWCRKHSLDLSRRVTPTPSFRDPTPESLLSTHAGAYKQSTLTMPARPDIRDTRGSERSTRDLLPSPLSGSGVAACSIFARSIPPPTPPAVARAAVHARRRRAPQATAPMADPAVGPVACRLWSRRAIMRSSAPGRQGTSPTNVWGRCFAGWRTPTSKPPQVQFARAGTS